MAGRSGTSAAAAASAASEDFGRVMIVDTETTGLDPHLDRIIEFAAVEVVDLLPTGRRLHLLIDPDRDISPEAVRIHGITRESLLGKPLFEDVVQDIVDFLDGAVFVAHNASFDVGMLDAEFRRCGLRALSCPVVDTFGMARGKFPNAKCDLSSLCRKYAIDLSSRGKHGALTDALLLAEVYLNLNGGRHRSLDLSGPAIGVAGSAAPVARTARSIGAATPIECDRHSVFVETKLSSSKKPGNVPFWLRIAEAAPVLGTTSA